MADMSIKADLDLDILKSGFIEAIADDTIEAVISDSEEIVKKRMKAVIKDKSRTELVNSVKGRKSKIGGRAVISPTGYPRKTSKRANKADGRRTRKVSNADIAYWLENGNSHQGAKPFIESAAKEVQTLVEKEVEEQLSRALKG